MNGMPAKQGDSLPCPLCGDEAWMCEKHSDRGWPHDECVGPGMPCPDCNASDPPRFGLGVLAVEYLTHDPGLN